MVYGQGGSMAGAAVQSGPVVGLRQVWVNFGKGVHAA